MMFGLRDLNMSPQGRQGNHKMAVGGSTCAHHIAHTMFVFAVHVFRCDTTRQVPVHFDLHARATGFASGGTTATEVPRLTQPTLFVGGGVLHRSTLAKRAPVPGIIEQQKKIQSRVAHNT